MHPSSYGLARVWRRSLAAALVLALSAISAGPASAQSKYASIVIDTGNGEVLYRANADDPKYPASLTKMMTLYLTFEALQKKRIKLGQYFPISRKAAGSRRRSWTSRPAGKSGSSMRSWD